MQVDSATALFIALTFVVPGFIVHSTLSVLVPRREDRTELSFARFLTLSAFNYAVWSWLVYLLLTSQWLRDRPAFWSLCWALIILPGPVLVGLIWGIVSQREWDRRILLRLGLQPVHPIPTAWAWRFGTMKTGHWILVRLKDGSQVAGYFGGKSFASSDPAERDLYVEQVWSIENGRWTKESPGKGILLSRGEISSIEFWPANLDEEGNP